MFGEPGDCYGSIYSIRARIGIANNTHFFNDCIHFIRFSLSLPYLSQRVCVCCVYNIYICMCVLLSGKHTYLFLFLPAVSRLSQYPSLHITLRTPLAPPQKTQQRFWRQQPKRVIFAPIASLFLPLRLLCRFFISNIFSFS